MNATTGGARPVMGSNEGRENEVVTGPVIDDDQAMAVGGTVVQARSRTGAGSWFGALWATAILFHLAANGAHLLALDRVGVVQLVMVVLAGMMLVRPGRAVAAALAGVNLVVLWLKLPVVGNHEVILGLVAMVVLLAALRPTAVRPTVGPRSSRSAPAWTVPIAPAARWVLLLAYGFIAVSKLNAGFFDPVASCAVVFAEALGQAFGVRPEPIRSSDSAVILGTAGIELAIPVLLIIRRTRTAGVLLALGFHFVLALDPVGHVWDFSATLLPLFLLFMPDGFHRQLDRAVRRVAQVAWPTSALALALLVAVQGLIMAGVTPLPTWTLAYGLWLGLGSGVGVGAVRFARGHRLAAGGGHGNGGDGTGDGESTGGGPADADATGLWRVAPVLALPVLLAVVIGLGPYLEYRTAAAFNMYSNLRVVDGDSNHYLIGSLRPGAGRSDPGVGPLDPSFMEVVSASTDSPLQFYIERGLALPVENLDRHLADHPDPEVTVRRGEAVISAEAADLGRKGGDGLWASLGDRLRYKLAFRRAVDLGPEGQCLRSWGPLG